MALPRVCGVSEEQLGAATETTYLAASFEDVYRSEYAPLVRLAVVLTGRLDVAEELVQDAFEAAHRRWATSAVMTGPAPGCAGSFSMVVLAATDG